MYLSVGNSVQLSSLSKTEDVSVALQKLLSAPYRGERVVDVPAPRATLSTMPRLRITRDTGGKSLRRSLQEASTDAEFSTRVRTYVIAMKSGSKRSAVKSSSKWKGITDRPTLRRRRRLRVSRCSSVSVAGHHGEGIRVGRCRHGDAVRGREVRHGDEVRVRGVPGKGAIIALVARDGRARRDTSVRKGDTRAKQE